MPVRPPSLLPHANLRLRSGGLEIVLSPVATREIATHAGTRTVAMELHADLTSYTGHAGTRLVDAGDVELRVGASSTGIRATLRLTMAGARREVGFDRVRHPRVRHSPTEMSVPSVIGQRS